MNEMFADEVRTDDEIEKAAASQELRRQRMKKYPQWFKVCANLHGAVIDFFAKDSDSIENAPEERMVQDLVPLHEATGVGSRTLNWKGEPCDWHQVQLDLDAPHAYIPSTTDGHGHLIFRKRMPWANYLEVLEVLAKHGLIEKGYVEAAKSRGETWLRPPWVEKTYQTASESGCDSGSTTQSQSKSSQAVPFTGTDE